MSVNQAQALAAPMSMAERWSMPSSVEGGYLLADPLTGQQIDTDRPPVWIQDDQILAGGLAYLRRNASQLKVIAFFGDHETSDDLGNPAVGWYERQVKRSDFYGYELARQPFAYHAEERMTIHGLARTLMERGETPSLDRFLKFAPSLGATSFQMRRMVASSLLGTPSFPADIIRDGTPTEQALAQSLESIVDHPDRELAGVAHMGYQNAREWISVARTGIEIEKHFGELHATTQGFLTYGTEHQDWARKARLMGVEVSVKKLAANDYDPKANDDMGGILSSGIVLPMDVPAITQVGNTMRSYLVRQSS